MRSRRVRAGIFVWIPLLLFSLGCGVKSLIYPVPRVPVGEPPVGFEETSLTHSDGVGTVLWHRDAGEGKPVLIYFHGNGENLETLKWSGLYERLGRLGTTVVIEYPGYGRAPGSPSEANLEAVAATAALWTRERYPDRSLVAMGWSLGAAVAIHLAATRPVRIDGLVALSPWASLNAVAAAHFPRWLVQIGLRERYDSIAAAPRIDCPVLIVHGGRDSIIPIAQAERLHAAMPAARLAPIAAAGHNDLLAGSAAWREIDAFLTREGAGEGV